MERALRLEVAKQKSLHGVWDAVVEKAMRRFGMINVYHYNRIIGVAGKGIEIAAWKHAPVAAYNVVCFDPKIHLWMTIWSTILKKGTPEELWTELEQYACDFKRDTILCSIDDVGNVFYRLFRPDTEERAYIQVRCDGTVESEHIERFVFKKEKKHSKSELLTLSSKCFTNKNQSCSFIENALGFAPHSTHTVEELIEAGRLNELAEPFTCMSFALDYEYLSYDKKREYAKVLDSVERFLLPFGYQKNKSASIFYRILDDGTYMQCMNFQKRRLELDRMHDTTFTVNVAFGYGKMKWDASDFRNADITVGAERIGHIAKGMDCWYELHPGADTQVVIDELLTDIRRVIAYLEEKRRQQI